MDERPTISLTPPFRGVVEALDDTHNRFSGFSARISEGFGKVESVKTVDIPSGRLTTLLKQGVNEIGSPINARVKYPSWRFTVKNNLMVNGAIERIKYED
jgi:hypothetical protein